MINAIISEFNPFHNGHKYLISEAKRLTGASFTVCIMSGNFVQRGEPAVCDKHSRAAAAVRGGADLVIQIPTAHSLSGASVFAESGVFLASALGQSTTLCFGSESEDITPLLRLAETEREALAQHFKEALKTGISYGAAVTKAYSALGAGDASILQSPNNLLAFEYIKAIKSGKYDIKIQNIKRVGTSHDSEVTEGGFASASYLRKNPDAEGFTPEKMKFTLDRARFDSALLFSLYTKSAEQLAQYADMNEGLENRFYTAVRAAQNIDELYSLVKTRRYTHAKIRRAALNVMLETPKGLHREMPPCMKVLAFNDRGRELLKELRQSAKLPIITKPADARKLTSAHIALEERASDVYDFFSQNRRGGGAEYRMSPVYVIDKTV